VGLEVREIEFVTDTTQPEGVAFNPTNRRIYVTNYNTGTVSTIGIDGDIITIPTPVGRNPSGIAYNEANGKMYVTVSGENKVRVISDHNVEPEPIIVGEEPTGIAYNNNGNMYVTNRLSGTVSIIDRENNVLQTLDVGREPRGIASNPTDNRVYVANTGSNTISVIGPEPLTQQAQNNRAICPENFVQHWDKIHFMLNSTKFAQSLNLPPNREFDIRVQDDASNITDIKQKVLDFLGVPNATTDTISIIDVDYSTICASSISSEGPTVQIVSPANRSEFSPNQTIAFIGLAQDAEDGQLSGTSLKWVSNLDGDIGTGEEINFALSGPPPGVERVSHTITLTATDSDGNSASSKILVLVGGIT
jgi:YVTN family beta-propeller protein